MHQDSASHSFSTSAFLGARATAGFGISTMVFGVLFGLAAVSQQFSAFDAVLMSATVFTASAQFAALAFWQDPVPYGTLALSTLLISARHVLLGLSLAPGMPVPSLGLRLLCMMLLTDPNGVLTLRADKSLNRPGYFIGGGLLLYVTWIIGTAVGAVFTDLLAGNYTRSLGFAGPLVLATMMVLLAKGNTGQWRAWLCAGLLAVLFTIMELPVFSVMPLSVAGGVLVCLLTRKHDALT